MVCGMDEIELRKCSVRKKDCEKVIWKGIPIGLLFSEDQSNWRITADLKGEFWTFDEFCSKDKAIESLVQKRQELDDYRVKLIDNSSVK